MPGTSLLITIRISAASNLEFILPEAWLIELIPAEEIGHVSGQLRWSKWHRMSQPLPQTQPI